ncbi:MAG: hypothetical protein ACRCX2_33330 [Paraclostridium sp.]
MFVNLIEQVNANKVKRAAIDFAAEEDIYGDDDDAIIAALDRMGNSESADDDGDIDEEQLLKILSTLGEDGEVSAEDLAGDNVSFNESALVTMIGIEESFTGEELSENMAIYLAWADKISEQVLGENFNENDTTEFIAESGINLSLSEGGCNKKERLSEDDGECDDEDSLDPDFEDMIDDDDIYSEMADIL